MPGRKPTKKKTRIKSKKNLTAKVKAAAIKGFNNQPQVMLGKTAYKHYQQLTPAQKSTVNKILIELALLLI